MKDSNEFGKNMHELLTLLKKILKSHKSGSNFDFSSLIEGKNVNLNLCFFTFLPLTEEELAEFEYEIEEYFLGEDREESHDLKFEITKKDLDFLKKNGLQF